ncbi:MarC family protein [Desulfurobacterium indicum]|uniref:UPF0056 membrane protein n=1 Tax=Desulfurobacterium indicum TaxID=1914305 RepID=A0A1R1MN85_9BACT|nr:MarC family protein [Desulfurobacterium indicum]OMH41281.1 antibiotic resistance protein MarC [Desulfurobacterium indicum]
MFHLNAGNLFLQDVISLVAILNPVAAAAVMISLLPPETPKVVTDNVALRTARLVFIACLVTLFFGDLIFKIFGININSIKVIGGLVLLVLSLNMINGKLSIGTKHTAEEISEAAEREDIAIVPLGIPVLFGPGVIATVIILKERSGSLFTLALLICAIAVASWITYVVLKNARILMKRLGITGFKIITRIMGLIVGAIASQFIISGVKVLWLKM